MKILYIDVDSLRPDHLGCYGYPRDTSPNIDRLAARGVRFTNHYASDVPCLPSRTALFSARYGFHTGVVNHGGLQADMRPVGARRPFNYHHTDHQFWVEALRFQGLHTAMISPFPGRHAAWHVQQGFLETHDTGKHAGETAGDVSAEALRWIKERGTGMDNWFLYINFWDPHTPYRTPVEFGNPFAGDPAPGWLTEDIIQRQRAGYGPMSARDLPQGSRWPGLPREIASREDFRRWLDGYDTAIRHVDEHVGRILQALEEGGMLDDTVVVLSADHGENQGELNVYGDHQTADHITCRIPLIIAGGGVAGGVVDDDFHYQLDVGPTLVELAGSSRRGEWDGVSFLPALTRGEAVGRPYLVVNQAAWSCQRAVRFDNWMLIRTYDDGLKEFPELMLFDVERDPHETLNLAEERPDIVGAGLRLMDSWVAEQMAASAVPVDPMWQVIHEGGPFHTRGMLAGYLEKLRAQGRLDAARRLETSREPHGRGGKSV